MSQEQLMFDEISDITQSTRIIDGYLLKALHCIINDYHKNLDPNALLLEKLNKYRTFKQDQNHYFFEFSHPIIRTQVYFLIKINIQIQLYTYPSQKKTNLIKLNILLKSALISNLNIFIQNLRLGSLILNSTFLEYQQLKQLNNFSQDRELYKLQALQTQHDEYSKYRSWSIQQQELKQQNKLKFDYQQKSSRQLRYSITTSTSPKQKSQTLSQTHKDQDYTIQIQRLKKEISQLESKLKHNN